MIDRPPVVLPPGELHMVEQGPNRFDLDFWYGGAQPANFPFREWRQLPIENLPRTNQKPVGLRAAGGNP